MYSISEKENIFITQCLSSFLFEQYCLFIQMNLSYTKSTVRQQV